MAARAAFSAAQGQGYRRAADGHRSRADTVAELTLWPKRLTQLKIQFVLVCPN
jgi:hypothetical protein